MADTEINNKLLHNLIEKLNIKEHFKNKKIKFSFADFINTLGRHKLQQ